MLQKCEKRLQQRCLHIFVLYFLNLALTMLYFAATRPCFSWKKLGLILRHKGSASAIVEPKQEEVISPCLISPVTVEQNWKHLQTVPCRRRRNLLMEKANKVKKKDDRH